ncbi:MAG: deoxyribodipyrimidine photolyase-related protein [Candidatus Saccharimonadales bacterium]|jgi:deoxyribodipyrimidine photolyase-related protein
MGKNVLIIYPYQLYDVSRLPKDVENIVVVEEPLIFGTDQQHPLFVHKQKLIFLRASMRRYIEEVLWPAGYKVDYVECGQMNETGDIVNRLSHFENVIYFDLNDDLISRRLEEAISGLNPTPSVIILDSPNFFITREEARSFLANKSKSTFAHFYQWQRERFNILINSDTYEPVGGKLSFEKERKKRLPKNHQVPGSQVFGANKFVEEARDYINKQFPNNPGSVTDFPWPTNHQESRVWLKEFLDHRLDHFSDYQEAIDGSLPWMYHSGISPLLNVGLLDPAEVIDQALTRQEQSPIPIANLENFIRQIVGWREYVRAIYIKQHVQLRASNTFGHNRKLTADWYNGTTGIPPVDDVIRKVLARSYSHHSERLMIIGNIMFLCDFDPNDVARWFMEMHIDAYDWAVVPNVYAMSQFADGGSIISKPFASDSNHILKMSHYEKGDWCDVWDGLYWRFVEKNKDRLSKNKNMSTAVKQLGKLSDNKKRIFSYRAEDFLRDKTAP